MRNSKSSWIVIVFFLLVVFFSFSGNYEKTENKISEEERAKKFNIISSQENKQLENILYEYAQKNNYEITIDYAGTLDIVDTVNANPSLYDAVWLSNSIWAYMFDSSVSLSNSKSTSINPIVFGIKKSKAEELGFVGKDVYLKDIVQAIKDGKLKFSMSNPTSTNSGASAYLGMLSTLAGNPEVLTKEYLQNDQLKAELKSLFTGLERSSGDEDYLEEMFLKGDFEAVVTYESSIISINKKIESENKGETLYAVYPIDGVSISDSPFALLNSKDKNKKKIFENIQAYILSNEGQKLLQEKGRRTWFGGVNASVDKKTFNPDWGINTEKYISPIKYPSTEVIKLALNIYQTELRKPVHVVFCLDHSGSMYGEGSNQLIKAMEYILTDEAANDFIQFTDEDKIDIIPFSSDVGDVISTENGAKTKDLLNEIKKIKFTGMTAIYPAATSAIERLKNEDKNKYNVSVVLMTDGAANVGSYSELKNAYYKQGQDIPIFSIMFGSAKEDQLEDIANLTNGKVFDGKTNLVSAFKEVRGYN